ncbi:hypothetical protein PF003_g28816 [Phytophthora fragariae]|nr:hypothetical protein PF003_g28816 [Phytophthora fragariae]
MQVLPIKETMSGAERNKRVRMSKRDDDESLLVPEEIDPYQRTYICTHGWKKRKSRCEGSRPRQHIRLTDHPFRFVVQWNMAKNSLQVKRGHKFRAQPPRLGARICRVSFFSWCRQRYGECSGRRDAGRPCEAIAYL